MLALYRYLLKSRTLATTIKDTNYFAMRNIMTTLYQAILYESSSSQTYPGRKFSSSLCFSVCTAVFRN